jgi:hypothetical protein
MALGGRRPGAGRPKGSHNTPQFHEYVTDEQRRAFVQHIFKQYKKDARLAVWLGDHIFGKARQPITGEDGGPILIKGVKITVRK